MYECIKELYLDIYDDDGWREDGYMHVPVGSKWMIMSDEFPLYIGGADSVHLERVWKTKKTKTHPWIEIDKDTLKEHFKKID